jgi:hypothetical protein
MMLLTANILLWQMAVGSAAGSGVEVAGVVIRIH